MSHLNNRAVIEINGVRDRLRVLLVSGEPHLGERTWRRLLKSDPAVDLVHFTILRPPERDDLTPTNELSLIAFPVRELFQVKIRDFDLIILDRFQNRNNILPPLYLRNIADYVRSGRRAAAERRAGVRRARRAGTHGAGQRAAGAGRARGGCGGRTGRSGRLVTELGARHPVTEDLPGWSRRATPEWGSWYRHIEAPARRRAGADERGRTARRCCCWTGSARDGWRCCCRTRSGCGRAGIRAAGRRPELLRRIAHWAMKEPALEEEALRARIEDDRLLDRAADACEDRPPGEVVVTSPGGADSRLRAQAGAAGLLRRRRRTRPSRAYGR